MSLAQVLDSDHVAADRVCDLLGSQAVPADPLEKWLALVGENQRNHRLSSVIHRRSVPVGRSIFQEVSAECANLTALLERGRVRRDQIGVARGDTSIVFDLIASEKHLREFASEALGGCGDIDTRAGAPGSREARRMPLRVYESRLSIATCSAM